MDVQAQDVVVGVDGSPSSDRALVWAVDQAVAERRRLALVHATGMITPAYHDAAVISPRDVQEMLREAGDQVLREARAAVRRRAPDVEVTTEFDVADPRQMLLDRSRTSAVMVVGSRGRGPVRSLLLGSTGVALARHGHCPVVVHRPTSGPGPRRGIVLAVD
ncbi:MAG: universal stress protein, partial [Marmoricola sp.]|nr:universal stress protein [Marmoricola sp.]